MTWQEDSEIVEWALDRHDPESRQPFKDIKDALDALARLIAALEATEEELEIERGAAALVLPVIKQRVEQLEAILALPPCNNIECERLDHLAGAARAALLIRDAK